MPRPSKKSARKRIKPQQPTSPPLTLAQSTNTMGSTPYGNYPDVRSVHQVGDEGGGTSLLNEISRQLAILRLSSECAHHGIEETLKNLIYSKEKNMMALLLTLYLLQGIPIGLASGSIPFLLESKFSYFRSTLFSLVACLHVFKLLWSPIVDSVFSPIFGRRKSWIVPLQFAIGSIMIWMSPRIQSWADVAEPHAGKLTACFVFLALLAETNGIAIDGWAITVIYEYNIPYASAARMVGFSTGRFLFCAGFLALNNVDFANKYIRTIPSHIPILSLKYLLEADEPYLNLGIVFRIMWDICKLEHVRSALIIHVFAIIGFQINDVVTSLKFLEKGFSQDGFALASFVTFVAQTIGGWYAASWICGSGVFGSGWDLPLPR